MINFIYPNAKIKGSKKIVKGKYFLENCSIHPDKNYLGISTRGKALIIAKKNGNNLQIHNKAKGRYRQIKWSSNGKNLFLIKSLL